MLNNIGVPGLILVGYSIFVVGFTVYSIFKVSNKDGEYHYAGFLRRSLASIIDGILINIIAFLVGLILGYIVESSSIEGIAALIGLVLAWLFFAGMESSKYQATPGKLALGIKVIDKFGNRIGFDRASGRHFAKILSFICLFVGFLMVGWTKRKQGLHDKLASCLVVTKKGINESTDRTFNQEKELESSRQEEELVRSRQK
jgi:uncharacterized RDD family membrane protein YckC